MKIKPIKTEDEYDTALARIYDLIQAEVEEDSPEYFELDELAMLVKQYEIEHYPIP